MAETREQAPAQMEQHAGEPDKYEVNRAYLAWCDDPAKVLTVGAAFEQGYRAACRARATALALREARLVKALEEIRFAAEQGKAGGNLPSAEWLIRRVDRVLPRESR